MALTRIRTSSILDRDVREQDLADGAVTFDKLNVSAPPLPGYVLTTDGFGTLVWNSPTGALVSLATLTDVDVTTIPPTLDQVLAFDGVDTWRPLSIHGLGNSSNTFVVANIAARNALSPEEGDQAFVRSGATPGEWELYLWDAAWILISSQDSASIDAKTISAIVVPATVSPVLLGNVSAGSRVTLVTIEVTIAFDFAPTLTVGDSGDNARIIDDTMFDLSEVGTYSCTTDVVYSGVPDTDINGYFTAGGATVGSARILVSYV